ncbi:cyanophycinase [Hymenobacter jeollabukensis]|uniref:Cyanophycinase n=1 Tax=Hymenobacter jeollabukensis TaxID=2025313 RepID=A0A5R8WU96_9BACT|nr:cyanophycinase [Hymenobacter jeollabukensis]TLM95341.1 cyanophycinase [Hymenobacter jeollabukensis]
MPPVRTLPKGTALLLGGGDDDALLALLCERLSPHAGPVEVVTTAATRSPVKTGRAYVDGLLELGCGRAQHLRVDEHNPADRPATLRRLHRAGAVFFTGGDQERITEHWLHTPALEVLRHRFHHDPAFVLAGTSAGASVVSASMIVAGHGARSLTKGGMHTAPGFGLLPQMIVDQHFAERGRFGRLAHAVLQHPAAIGLGLGQETGVIVEGGRHLRVFGDGVVMVVDGRQVRNDNLGRIGRGEPVAGENLHVHLLVAGRRLDLRTRRVLPAETDETTDESARREVE